MILDSLHRVTMIIGNEDHNHSCSISRKNRQRRYLSRVTPNLAERVMICIRSLVSYRDARTPYIGIRHSVFELASFHCAHMKAISKPEGRNTPALTREAQGNDGYTNENLPIQWTRPLQTMSCYAQ